MTNEVYSIGDTVWAVWKPHAVFMATIRAYRQDKKKYKIEWMDNGQTKWVNMKSIISTASAAEASNEYLKNNGKDLQDHLNDIMMKRHQNENRDPGENNASFETVITTCVSAARSNEVVEPDFEDTALDEAEPLMEVFGASASERDSEEPTEAAIAESEKSDRANDEPLLVSQEEPIRPVKSPAVGTAPEVAASNSETKASEPGSRSIHANSVLYWFVVAWVIIHASIQVYPYAHMFAKETRAFLNSSLAYVAQEVPKVKQTCVIGACKGWLWLWTTVESIILSFTAAMRSICEEGAKASNKNKTAAMK